MTCLVKGCSADAPYRATCSEHSRLFDRIRAELKAEVESYDPKLRSRRHGYGRPTCVEPGCPEPRPHGGTYCALHEGLAVGE